MAIAGTLASVSRGGLICVIMLLWVWGPGYLAEQVLFFVPGRALLVRATLWLGLSLSIVPLVYLWTTTLGLQISFPALLVASGLLLLGGTVYGLRELHTPMDRLSLRDTEVWIWFGILLVLVSWRRLDEIKGLVFPPWVDAVHHALIVRVVAETGQVPYSLQPYLPIDHFVYHWGYHAVVATIWRLGNLPLNTVMLWFGQLLQVASVVTVGGAACALFRRPIAAGGAALVTGLLSLMPAYYLSWGRYTLLAGVVVLGGVIVATWEWQEKRGIRRAGLVVLLLAGLNLIHFVLFAMALLWCASLWIFVSVPAGRSWRDTWKSVLLLVATLLLTAPWMAQLVQQSVQQQSHRGPLSIVGGDYNKMPDELLWVTHNRELLAAALLAGAISVWQRRRAALVVVGWSLAVTLCANPVWFGLPYLSFFANRFLAILLFLPVSLAIGAAFAALDAAIDNRISRAANGSLRHDATRASTRCRPTIHGSRVMRGIALSLVTLGSLVWARQLPAAINAGTILARTADERALQWIALHTPSDARFVVNTTQWLYDIGRGVDGGWWLLPLTGRQMSTPPVIYTYGPAAYVVTTQQSVSALLQLQQPADIAKGAAGVASWMQQRGFQYAYATLEGPEVFVASLRESPQFEQVYGDEQVGIFKLR
ncbi:MAG: hypothetical protein NVS2B7_24450 [Herpetosiphon sp.]